MAKRMFVWEDSLMDETGLLNDAIEGDEIVEVAVVKRFKLKLDKNGELKLPGGKS